MGTGKERRERERERVVSETASRTKEDATGNQKVTRLTDPLVVKLVNVFVDLGMVLESMNPVDPRIREEEESWDREDSVSPSIIRYIFIEAPVPPHFSEEPWEGHEGHPRESNHRSPNFHPDLSLDEPRVLHHVVIEEEEVRQRREG